MPHFESLSQDKFLEVGKRGIKDRPKCCCLGGERASAFLRTNSPAVVIT